MKETLTENQTVGANPVSISEQILLWNAQNRNNAKTQGWNAIIATVVTALVDIGWYVSMPTDLIRNAEHIHVYPGINNGKLVLFAIDAAKDVPGVDIDKELVALPIEDVDKKIQQKLFVKENLKSKDAVTINEAIRRMYRWGTDWLRNAWIGEVRSSPISNDDNLNFLFSALVIKTKDFDINHSFNYHLCGLSLKESYVNNKVNFDPDLTIMDLDVSTGEISYVLEDVVYSIPPIKPNFSYSDFAVLEKLIPTPN